MRARTRRRICAPLGGRGAALQYTFSVPFIARTHRHLQKVGQLGKAVDAFANKRGLEVASVKEILHEQYMSDEASGPEDEDETSMAVWRTKMIFKGGYGDVAPDAVAKLSFVEVLDADWRSNQVSVCLQRVVELFNVASVVRRIARYG